MPEMGYAVAPQLERGAEEAGAGDGKQRTRCGEERKHGPRCGKRGEMREWPLFVITEEVRREAEDC